MSFHRNFNPSNLLENIFARKVDVIINWRKKIEKNEKK